MEALNRTGRGEVLVFFGKEPRAGRVKTRLVPPLTAEEAADLYRAFLLDICGRQRSGDQRLVLAVAPPFDRSVFEGELPARVALLSQRGPDLGARLAELFERQFAPGGGVRRVVVRNTDSPLLPEAIEQEAFAALARGAEIVLGPDLGGGYYLVGLSRPFPELFRLPMSVPSNFERTVERARSLTERVALLPPFQDVDRIEDLRQLAATLAHDPAARGLAPRTVRALAALPAL
jgi:hypothetical protein